MAGGKAETQQYKIDGRYTGAKIPADLNAHWWRVDETSCTLTKI